MKLTGVIIVLVLFLIAGCGKNEVVDHTQLIGVAKYPYVFLDETGVFNAKIVVEQITSDDELIIAQRYVEFLNKQYKLLPDTLIQYHQLPGLYTQNTIYIGTCNMQPHNRFVNIFMDCLSMEKDIAMMRLVQHEDITILSVVGKDFKDTEEALSVLMNYKKYNLSGNEIQVRNDESGRLFTRITG